MRKEAGIRERVYHIVLIALFAVFVNYMSIKAEGTAWNVIWAVVLVVVMFDFFSQVRELMQYLDERSAGDKKEKP